MLVLEYALTEKEFLDFNFYTSWQSPESKPRRIKYYVTNLVTFLSLVVVFEFTLDRGRFTPLLLIIWGIVIIILMVGTVLRIHGWYDKHAKKVLSQSGYDTILPRTTLTINEKGIFSKTT